MTISRSFLLRLRNFSKSVKKIKTRSFLHTVHVVSRCRPPNPCLPQQQDTIPYVVKKNISLALLKMGKSLPETC